MYVLLMKRESGGPVATGSAWRAFFMIWQLNTDTDAQSSTVSATPSLPMSLLASTRPGLRVEHISVVPAITSPRLAACCWKVRQEAGADDDRELAARIQDLADCRIRP